jgi:cell division transport system ATP-binding protein
MESTAVLSLRNASILQGDHRVLSDVNLEVAPGEFIYVIGATGSGKSSLLKTLYADLPLASGEGRIVGYDLRNLNEREIPYLRRQLGIVFQDFQLLMDRSVRDNLNCASSYRPRKP